MSTPPHAYPPLGPPATRAVPRAIAYEPRVLFDEIPLDSTGLDAPGLAGALVNLERFPLLITHLTASLHYLDAAGAVSRAEALTRVGLALVSRDAPYMDRGLVPLPTWANTATAASHAVTAGLSSWRFLESTRLHVGERLDVTVQLEEADAAPVPVQLGFMAVGAQTGNLRFLSEERLVTSALPETFAPAVFTNPYEEPLLLRGLTLNTHAPLSAADPAGDVRRVRLGIAPGSPGRDPWFRSAPSLPPRVPGGLLGVTTGRSLVHVFPEPGILLEPGQGFGAVARTLVAGFAGTLHLGLVGHLLVA